MEQAQRIFLYLALFIVAFFLWLSWNKYNESLPKTHKAPVAQQAQNTGSTASSVDSSTTASSFPTIGSTKATTKTANPKDSAVKAVSSTVPANRLVEIHTGVMNIGIDKLGGSIVSLNLPKYPVSLKEKNTPFTLLSNDPSKFYIAQSALIGAGGPDSTSKLALYSTPQSSYSLTGNTLDVNLTWKSTDGLEVTKQYQFEKDSYLIKVNYIIKNNSSKDWTGRYFTQLTRKEVKESGSHFFSIHPYYGAAISSPDKRYQEISFKDMAKDPVQKSIKDGWAAMVQRYFVSAWVPDSNQTFNYYSKASGDVYTIGMASQPITIAPGQTKTVSAKLYSGPEITSVLKNIAPGLEQTVSYGWLWFISVIIFWVMNKIYLLVGNWGWSIILVTVLIKLMFYHLSAKSYSSMAKMRGLQPKIQAMRERYADDKQKQSQAMMELYKKEKVNPVGGCLPIVVQIPVFFALYMVLIESVQLRQAPWILWIHNLAAPDPYFILPIIMGVTMFVQQKLNPPPPDPTQAKVMMFLPVIFTVLFAYFPAGLVLYWVVNNVLSVAQQWHITRNFEKKAAANKHKKIKNK